MHGVALGAVSALVPVLSISLVLRLAALTAAAGDERGQTLDVARRLGRRL
jgi:hypothetical protein